MKAVVVLFFVVPLALTALAIPIPNPQLLAKLSGTVYVDGIAHVYGSVDGSADVTLSFPDLTYAHDVNLDVPLGPL
ncbi:hypothetical protein BGY98DRAFT_968964 [Russula aff. rugulosa BPL654]|nr:hypothetical protein BGY98DRAFT_968964 [Russula aff. rugulosa BPL654]